MSEYLSAVFVASLICGLFGYLSHGKLRSAERIAIGIIMLYIIFAPITDLVTDFRSKDFATDVTLPDGADDDQLSSIAMEAFENGVALLVADEFSLSRENIRVRAEGFDFEKMKAERLVVILCGSAVTADYRMIENYLNEQNFGSCEVEIEVG